MTPRQIPPETVISTSFHDLCLYLGGSPDSFTGLLLTLIDKADPGNLATLSKAFPRHVAARQVWQDKAPLTWGEMDTWVTTLEITMQHVVPRQPAADTGRLVITVTPNLSGDLEVMAVKGHPVIATGCNQCGMLLLTADAGRAVRWSTEHAHNSEMFIVEVIAADWHARGQGPTKQ